MPGKLILLPNLLEESLSTDLFLPKSVQVAVSFLDGLIAESEKGARRYLRHFLSQERRNFLPISLLNEHTSKKGVETLLIPVLGGQTWGVIADAGLPCVADPGADLVAFAQKKRILLEVIPGPCSLILALQLSGFSGQRFCFHGYLPRETLELEKALKELEKKASGETQIWIETPYRTAKLLEFLKRNLSPRTRLCMAINLTMPSEKVMSMTIHEWKMRPFKIEKDPSVFLMYRDPSED